MSEKSETRTVHPGIAAYMLLVGIAAMHFFGQADSSSTSSIAWAAVQLVSYTVVMGIVVMFLIWWVGPRLKEMVSRA